jgi:hypothetical protein
MQGEAVVPLTVLAVQLLPQQVVTAVLAVAELVEVLAVTLLILQTMMPIQELAAVVVLAVSLN